MRFRWIRKQWADVKGDVKFWLLSTILGGAIAGGTWTVTRVERLVHELPASTRTTLIAAYVVTFAGLVAAVSWAIAASRLRQRPSEHLTIKPLPSPAEAGVVPRRLPKDIDLHVEIRDILFRRKGGFMGMGSFYTLVNIRVTNRGHGSTEPAAIDWRLDLTIGDSYHGHGKVVPIFDSWRLEWQVDGGAKIEEIPQPTLDVAMQSASFKKGTPYTGWVLFEVFQLQAAALPPYNAEAAVTITDSMGNDHRGVRPPDLYVENVKIVTV